jgi:hypothetical protein
MYQGLRACRNVGHVYSMIIGSQLTSAVHPATICNGEVYLKNQGSQDICLVALSTCFFNKESYYRELCSIIYLFLTRNHTIENFVALSTCFLTRNHPIENFVSLSTCFFNKKSYYRELCIIIDLFF